MSGSSVWRRRALEFSSGTWYRYGLIVASLLALVAVLSGAPFALKLLGFVPLFVVVGVRVAAIRGSAGNQARAQALLPTLERHLAGSRAAWVLSAAANGQIVDADLRELFLLRNGRDRVRVWVVDRDEPDEHVMLASARAEDVIVERYRFGHVQDKRVEPIGEFFTLG